jgi:hypothetical protein
MIYELRAYTLRTGKAPEAARNAGEIGRRIRGDDYGKLEGYWLTEIGPLNQVVHLWSYESLDERQRLRGALAENEAWRNEYLPLLRPHLVQQEVRLMHSILGPKAPERTGNVYELRCYQTEVGRAREWAKLISDYMPAREKYSKNVALWVVEAADPNEVCHIWAYDDLNARMAARGAAAQDPEWQEFLATSAPLLLRMQSTIMLPAAHSPLQ